MQCLIFLHSLLFYPLLYPSKPLLFPCLVYLSLISPLIFPVISLVNLIFNFLYMHLILPSSYVSFTPTLYPLSYHYYIFYSSQYCFCFLSYSNTLSFHFLSSILSLLQLLFLSLLLFVRSTNFIQHPLH